MSAEHGTSGETDHVDRRAYLAILGGSAPLLAGCLGDDDGGDDSDDGDSDGDSDGTDGDDGELGERVGTVGFRIIGGIGAYTTWFERAIGITQDAMESEFGVETEVDSVELLSFWDAIYNDQRTHHLHIDFKGLVPARLDPQPLLEPSVIQNAGANGRQSLTQLASCEYTELVNQQSRATSEEERRELVHEAIGVASDAVDRINLMNLTLYGGYRSDQINPNDTLGTIGVQSFNVEFFLNSTSTDGSERIAYTTPDVLASPNHLHTGNTYTVLEWSTLYYSPLVYYGPDLEMKSHLAEDWEIENDFQTVRMFLRDDAHFTNGDRITPEDVQWTFQYLDEYSDSFADAAPQPWDSIDIVDDTTIEFNFTEPNPTWLRTEPFRWGILPKDHWIEQGAEEEPGTFQPNLEVTGGPYTIDTFRREELIDVSPHEGFWDPPEEGFTLRAFDDIQGAVRAYENGEINIIDGLSAAQADRWRQNRDDTGITTMDGFNDYWMITQTNFGPTKFREFRLAVSQLIPRQEINEVAAYGDLNPHLYSSILGQTHPFYPDNPDEVLTKIAESPTGDPEVAKQTLRDAGWSWDDDGNLRYPAGADLDPLWPEGESPMEYPDRWPCVEDIEM